MSNWTPKLTVLKDQNGTIIQKTIQRTQDGPIELLDVTGYASTEEVEAMLQPDTRTPEQKKQAALDDKNWRNEQGADGVPWISTCNETLLLQNKPYPHTCKKCGLGPCAGKTKQEQVAEKEIWIVTTPEETLDWLAQQHFDQCREERPIQNWIRGMKAMLPKDVL